MTTSESEMEEFDSRAVAQEAIDRWSAKHGWKPDFAVVEGFCIAVNEQYAEIAEENKRLKAALRKAGAHDSLVERIAKGK